MPVVDEPTRVGPPAQDPAVQQRSRPRVSRPWILAVVVLLFTGALVAVQLTVFLSRSTGGAAEQTFSAALSTTVTEYPPTSRAEPVDLSGTGLTGEVIDITAWRGDVVVLNMWGSWCPPCRQEAPILAATSAAYADDGVRFLGVNVRDSPAAAIAFEERYAITYPSIDNSDGKAVLSLAEHLPGSGVPVTLILDREERPAARVLGAVQESTLTALLDSVRAEQNTSSS